MNNKYVKPLILIAAFLILAITTVASYAYFSASVNGNTTAQQTVITSGNIALLLTDGNQVSLNNAFPGSSLNKTFKVKNTGTVATTYDVYLSEIVNSFADKNDLVYTLSSATGCPNATETVVPSEVGEQSKIISSCSINPNVEHEYTLSLTFKEDGTNQDDNKGKKFEAKISLNEYKEASKTIAQTMLELKTNGSTNLEYDGVDTLVEYGTTDNNLRYIGANPDNYIYFNCSTTNPSEMNDTTCEKWRIIGLMNNIVKENGTTASLIKIRRAESLGYYSWDTSESSESWVNGGKGVNQWGESGTYEGADLMRELNTDYLGTITVGTDGNWYNSSDNDKGPMPTSTISNSAQSMIETVVWNLGSPSNNGGTYDSNWSSNITPSTSYTRERAETNGKTCSDENYCNDTVTRTSTWTGKVGLIYPSDYGYATSGGSTTNRATCLSTSMASWNGSSVSDCITNSWILKSPASQWSLSPFAFSIWACNVFHVSSSGRVQGSEAYRASAFFPVVFLKSNVSITSGDGSSSNPYKLTM